jgi:hypothetical protein
MDDGTLTSPQAASDRMTDVIRQSEALRRATSQAAVDFLRTELQVAHTLLDLADSAMGAGADARRRDQARMAVAEVAKGLAKEGHITFTESERNELTTGLTELAQRLDPAP